MDKNQKFLIVKNKDSKEIAYFEYDKIKGYDITPKKNLNFKDCINVNKMIIINPSLIENLVNRKVKNRFKRLIDLLTTIYDGDDDTGAGLKSALNEIEKFKWELHMKYKMYMKENEVILLDKKLSILENEVKLRFLLYTENNQIDTIKEGKSR